MKSLPTSCSVTSARFNWSTTADCVFEKKKQKRILKQRSKHPIKIHIWGGISARGATKLVMFIGILNATRLGAVYEAGLVPFIEKTFPDGHRLYQDNDPKHASKHIDDFLNKKKIVWWYSPPESPDLNPIELVWGSLKQFLRNQRTCKNLKLVLRRFGLP